MNPSGVNREPVDIGVREDDAFTALVLLESTARKWLDAKALHRFDAKADAELDEAMRVHRAAVRRLDTARRREEKRRA